MTALPADVRQAFRSLSRHPAYALAAIVTLALGIGCATAIFSAFNATVLHPLPYPGAGRIIRVQAKSEATGGAWGSMPLPVAIEIQSRGHVFASAGFYGARNIVNLTDAGLYAQVDVMPVAPSMFRVLDVRPELGRWLRPDDQRQGNSMVAVISHSLWVQHFAGHPKAIGETVRLDNKPYRVVGVMPAGFEFPDPFVQAWLPETVTPSELADRGSYGTPLLARLKPGTTLEGAEAVLNTLAKRIAQAYPETAKGLTFRVVRLEDEVTAPISRAFWLLLGGVGTLLLIACANVANLLLARNAAREHEFAVRISLGAGRLRLARLIFTENMLVALLGGVAGAALAGWGINGLRLLASNSITRLTQARIDGWVLGFAIALAVLTGVIFGIVPLLRIARFDFNGSLRNSGSTGVGLSRPGGAQSILVIVQVALVVVLLTGAGLMLSTLSNLLNAPLGFEPHNLLGAEFQFPLNQPTADEMRAFQRRVLEEVRATPGVESAALGSNLPFHGAISTMFLYERENRGWLRSPLMEENKVGSEYFRTMGIPLVGGREFSGLDSGSSSCVAILNRAAATVLWPGQNPVGKILNLSVPMPGVAKHGAAAETQYCEVVGQVADARFAQLTERPGPEIYFSRLQNPAPQPVLMVRTAGSPLAMANAVLDRADSIDKNQRVMWAFSMEQLINRSALRPRFRAVLLTLFAGLTLLIAAFGIYGVMAYRVSQRTKEIGIRMAFGAQRGDVMTMVVGQALLLSIIGLAVGIATSLALGRAVSGFLYGIRPTDPLNFAGVAAIILVATALASYCPARRATRIDPAKTLRYE